jgi:hypothetical protein
MRFTCNEVYTNEYSHTINKINRNRISLSIKLIAHRLRVGMCRSITFWEANTVEDKTTKSIVQYKGEVAWIKCDENHKYTYKITRTKHLRTIMTGSLRRADHLYKVPYGV